MRLDSYKYIYLIGIGGIGMSALARYFNAKGQIVFGYDRIRSELCVELENEKIQIRYKDEVSSIPDQIKDTSNKDILVIYTPAIPSNNYIFSFFNNKGFKIFKRAEILGFISKRSFTIAVAGTHGKTTTSTILAHLLQQAGKNVTAFLGGISRNYNTNILLTDKSDVLIIEADEYDKSFLHIHADIAIITSVDIDHLDTYKDKWDLHLGFKQFASQVKQKGLLLVEESIAIDFDKPYLAEKRTYSSKKKADYFAENIGIVNGRMLFDVIVPEKTQKDIEFQMPGLHNVNNSIAALAVSYYLGLSLNEISKGLATFKGIGRRYEKHINTKELVYIDDYAHHPVEVSKTIDTTRKLYPSR